MSFYDEDIIEKVKNSLDIVDILAEYISLERKGKNYHCLCPFHNDSNPSMVVSKDKQIYKCFSCGAGGNVITFVQEYEKISFAKALQKLAYKIGLEINNYEYENKDTNLHLNEYYNINNEAANLYEYLVYEYDNQDGYEYLQSRGLTEEIIKYFRIGYSSSNNKLYALLKSKDYDLLKAVEMGLLHLNPNNEYVDAYSHRVTYPIIENENVLGFTCRSIVDNTSAKYINSIESKVFIKHNILYNIDNAKDTIVKEKKVYIVEGPNDVISFYKVGILNCICVMGTALSSDHIKKLQHLNVNEIILAFDGDEPGINATIKASRLISNTNIKVKYINFDSLDPDDYLKKQGLTKFRDVCQNPTNIIDLIIKYKYSLINENNYEEKKNFVKEIIKEINNKLDSFDKEYYFNHLANTTGISFDLILSYANNGNNKHNDNNYSNNYNYQKNSYKDANYNNGYNQINRIMIDFSTNLKTISDIESARINLLYFMMNDRKYFDVFSQDVKTFVDEKSRKLYNMIASYYISNDIFDLNAFDDSKYNKSLVSELMVILSTFDYERYHNSKIFDDSINIIKLESKYTEIEILQERLKHTDDPIERAKISQEIFNIKRYMRNEKSKNLEQK